jgi:hypothetical protein
VLVALLLSPGRNSQKSVRPVDFLYGALSKMCLPCDCQVSARRPHVGVRALAEILESQCPAQRMG